jgi:hypothetical protein
MDIQVIRLVAPLVLTGHYPPELKNIEASDKMALQRAETGVFCIWTNAEDKICQTFVPDFNIIQIIYLPEAKIEKRLPGRPKKD